MEISKKIENAIIFSVLTSGCFLIGWMYVGSYWKNFGINHLELSLDFNYYLISSFPAIAILFFILIIYYQINDNTSELKHFHLYIFLTILLFSSVIMAFNTLIGKVIYGLITIIVLIIGGILFYKYIAKTKKVDDKLALWYRIIFFAIVYIFLVVASKSLATYRANQFLNEDNLVFVSFEDYEGMRDTIKNKKYFLLIYSNEKYYVLDSSSTRVIVIPEQKDRVVFRTVIEK